MSSVFASQIRNRPWVRQVTILSALFGALLATSLKTQDRIRGEGLPSMRPQKMAAAWAEMRETVNAQKKKIADLQANLTRYQAAAAKETDNSKLLYDDLRKANVLAGLVAVRGPGIVVTLRDAKERPSRPDDLTPEAYTELMRDFIIHDSDIQAVVNELRAAGAEAIAINDQRVVATTAIRCVGPVVVVNNSPTNGSPVRIQAVGDPDTLQSAMAIANGIADQYKPIDPSMFSMDKVKDMTLPAYAGATPLRYAQPAEAAAAEQAQKRSEKAAEDAPDPTGRAQSNAAPAAVPAATGQKR